MNGYVGSQFMYREQVISTPRRCERPVLLHEPVPSGLALKGHLVQAKGFLGTRLLGVRARGTEHHDSIWRPCQ